MHPIPGDPTAARSMMASNQSSIGSMFLDPRDALEIAQRRWRWLALGLVIGLIAGVALWWSLPRRYLATTMILVEPQEIPETYVRSTITLELQHRVQTLRQRVTSHNNLAELIERVGVDGLDPSREKSIEELMDEVRKNLVVNVESPRDSQVAVVEISFEAGRADVVAPVLREIADLFVTENRKERTKQAASTSRFLEQELSRMRSELTEQERRIRDFRSEHSGSLPSQLDANVRQLDRLSESLSESIEGEEKLVHQLAQLQGETGVGSATNPDTRKVALAEAREKLIAARSIYTDEHPHVLAIEAQIERLERAITEKPEVEYQVEWLDPRLKREIDTFSFALESRREESAKLRDQIEVVQRRIDEAPRNEQELEELTRDYDTMKQTYRLLLGNIHDAGLSRNLEAAQMAEQFKLLRPAHQPSDPFFPNPLQVIPAGVLAGLGLASLLVLLAEIRRPAFHSPEGLARRLGLPIFASIPDIIRERVYDGTEPPSKLDWRLVVPCAPNSAVAEQYRGFVPYFLEAGSCGIVLVTSAQSGDGKTVSCLNLACTLATDLGRTVLVIDADMRRASQHKLVNARRSPGLSDVLRGDAELTACAINIVPNLWLLPAGSPVDNPLALINDETFFKLCERARENYEVILIDSPPILPVIDAKILRRMADMVVFVIRAGVTPSEGVIRSLLELKNIAGVVFNRVSAGSYKRYYYHDAYSHYEYSEPEVPAGPAPSSHSDERDEGGDPERAASPARPPPPIQDLLEREASAEMPERGARSESREPPRPEELGARPADRSEPVSEDPPESPREPRPDPDPDDEQESAAGPKEAVRRTRRRRRHGVRGR